MNQMILWRDRTTKSFEKCKCLTVVPRSPTDESEKVGPNPVRCKKNTTNTLILAMRYLQKIE